MNEMLVRIDEVRFMGNVKTRVILPPGSSKKRLPSSEVRQKGVILDPVLFIFTILQQRLLGLALYLDFRF